MRTADEIAMLESEESPSSSLSVEPQTYAVGARTAKVREWTRTLEAAHFSAPPEPRMPPPQLGSFSRLLKAVFENKIEARVLDCCSIEDTFGMSDRGPQEENLSNTLSPSAGTDDCRLATGKPGDRSTLRRAGHFSSALEQVGEESLTPRTSREIGGNNHQKSPDRRDKSRAQPLTPSQRRKLGLDRKEDIMLLWALGWFLGILTRLSQTSDMYYQTIEDLSFIQNEWRRCPLQTDGTAQAQT